MKRAWRRSLVSGVASAMLAAMSLCTVMATLAAVPEASACHERPAHDGHGEAPAVFACCATVVKASATPAAPESDAALPAIATRNGHAAPRTARYSGHPASLSVSSPPAFLRHSSLLL